MAVRIFLVLQYRCSEDGQEREVGGYLTKDPIPNQNKENGARTECRLATYEEIMSRGDWHFSPTGDLPQNTVVVLLDGKYFLRGKDFIGPFPREN